MCVQFLHKLTARALIRDYEDGNLDTDEAEHEVCVCASLRKNNINTPHFILVILSSQRLSLLQGKKAELKSYIIELSKEFSILSQFTSFVAIEERVRAHSLTKLCIMS